MTPYMDRFFKRDRLGRAFQSPDMNVVHTRILDKDVKFCVRMENDPIQRNHRRGSFYEMKELVALQTIFPKNGTFVDIGANVGNHSLFAAMFLNAKRVIPFEPNKLAYELLLQNVLMNNLRDQFDLSHIGIGLSDEHSGGFAMQSKERNLGSAKMLAGKGQLEVFRADERLKDIDPAMVKIDVEGMEMNVLRGLEGVLKRCRPILLVEVDNQNEDAFMAWSKDNDYEIASTYQRYKLNKNHILADKGKVKSIAKKLDDAEKKAQAARDKASAEAEKAKSDAKGEAA